jgi:ferredoxin
MKVHADHDVCIGSGLCALRAPSVFDQDEDDGRVVILRAEPDSDQRAVVLEAVQLCPSGALRTDLDDR